MKQLVILKSWLIEWLGIKLVVWFSTMKMYNDGIQSLLIGAFDIPLKFSFHGLQLCFRKILNQTPYEGVMNLQNNNLENFKTPPFANLENSHHFNLIPIVIYKISYREKKCRFFLNPSHDEALWTCFSCNFVNLAPIRTNCHLFQFVQIDFTLSSTF